MWISEAMKKMTKFKQNVIALVYDFDGTLTPEPMQEYTVLPELGVKPKEFWDSTYLHKPDLIL